MGRIAYRNNFIFFFLMVKTPNFEGRPDPLKCLKVEIFNLNYR